jgi:hypothetical protein
MIEAFGRTGRSIGLVTIAVIAFKNLDVAVNDFTISGMKIHIDQPYVVGGSLCLLLLLNLFAFGYLFVGMTVQGTSRTH